jgi:hypothetical protein
MILYEGNISSVSILGQTLVILNSRETAMAMLDKKSSIYSDRPVLQMCGELCGWSETQVLLRYGERLRRARKMFHHAIGTSNALNQYLYIEEQESHRFIRRVLENPDALTGHIRQYASSNG